MKKIYNGLVFSPDEPVGAASDPVEETVVESPQQEPEEVTFELEIDELLSDVEVEDPVVAQVTVEESLPPLQEEPVVETPPVVEDPVVETPQLSEVDELKATIERLTAQLDKISGPKPAEIPVVEGSVADPVQVPPIPKTAEDTVLDLVELYRDVDLSTVMDTKEGFLKFMGDILKAQDAITRKSIIDVLPQVVTPVVSGYTSQQKLAAEFYEKHPHLSKIKNYVGQVAVEVQAANQDKTLEEILDLTAAAVNEVIGFKEVPSTPNTSEPVVRTPVLPGATGGVRTKPAPTNTLQDEISELIND